MQPKDPNYREHVRRIFETAQFVETLGIQLSDVGPGWC